MSDYKLKRVSPYLGMDPEAFLRGSDGKIITSDQVIPIDDANMKRYLSRDGVQMEFHTSYFACRESGAAYLSTGMTYLKGLLAKTSSTVDWSQVLELTQEEFDSLDAASRKLGCEPSLNLYDADAKVGVDQETYRIRSAGGHIHFGVASQFDPSLGFAQCRMDQWETRMVTLCDLIIGNTCVLLDRDPLNATRRQVYGRAGEYRLPKHGLEYRTLSNFWLISYPMMSLVFNLAKLVYSVLHSNVETLQGFDVPAPNMKYSGFDGWGAPTFADEDYKVYQAAMVEWHKVKQPVYKSLDPGSPNFEQELCSRMDLGSCRKAINENDFDLAFRNFLGLRSFIDEFLPAWDKEHASSSGIFPLSPSTMDDFLFFIETVHQRGDLQGWFPDDPIPRWIGYASDPPGPLAQTKWGWEMFLINSVRVERLKRASVTVAA